MKILMVTSGMDIGGAETHISELCFALADRGVSVWVASAGGVLVSELEKRGIPHITLPLDRKTPRALLTAKSGLSDLILREHFDIVHAHARIPAFLCGRLRRKLGFCFVTTDHARFCLTPPLRRLTDWGEFTFAVSEDLRKYLMENFRLDPARLALTVNGIDTERFSASAYDPSVRECFCARERAVVLHISRLEKRLAPCVRALMAATELLRGQITLAVAGDGAYAEILRGEAAALNAKLGYEAAVFLGAVTDVERYIAAADIVVSPSRAAMEAMACEKPTVVCGAQGYGGIFGASIEREAIRSNFCFRGSPLPSPDVIARDIRTVLNMDERERAALVGYGRRFICENYSLNVMSETHLDGYRRALGKSAEYDILICGYYGYGNAGDETLLAVTVGELLRRNPSLCLCALSADPEHTRRVHGIDAVARFDLDRVGRTMARAKMLLFGGGNLLQDKTSTHSLLYYTHILRMAKKRNMKILVYANGIGPLSGERNLHRVRNALALADEISLRDPDSFAFVKQIFRDKPARLTFDPAILVEKEAFPVPDGDYFVVAPKRISPFFTEALISLIRALARERGMTPILVSMYDGQDARLVGALAARTGAVAVRPNSAGEFLTLFSSARLVISSRLHGLVYATAAACPMVGYSDDPKIFSYLNYIGIGSGAHPDCGIHTDECPERAIERAKEVLDADESVRSLLRTRLPEWKSLAEGEITEVIRLLDDTNG